MFRILMACAQICLAVGSPAPTADGTNDPGLTIIDAGPEDRQLISAAVRQFAAVGLELPDLVIRMHEDTSGCRGKQGMFQPSDDGGVIDLCFSREFLVLHELGHAWAHEALDDAARADFLHATGFETWGSSETPWSRRGAERAADAIAHGLLSTPLPAAATGSYERDFDRFELLTGFVTPRLDAAPCS